MQRARQATSSSPHFFHSSSHMQPTGASPLDGCDSAKNSSTLLREKVDTQNCRPAGQTREFDLSDFSAVRHKRLPAMMADQPIDRRRSLDLSLDKQHRRLSVNQHQQNFSQHQQNFNQHQQSAIDGSISLNSSNSTDPNSTANNPKYKTEMCRSVFAKVACKYGENCQFAHSEEEMRNRQHNNKYKTIDCKNFHQHGYCYYGPKCDFRHNEPLPPQQMSQFTGAGRKIRSASLVYGGGQSPLYRPSLGDSSSLSSLSRAGSDGESPAPSDCAVVGHGGGVSDWSSTLPSKFSADWSAEVARGTSTAATSSWSSPVPSSTLVVQNGASVADWPPTVQTSSADWSTAVWSASSNRRSCGSFGPSGSVASSAEPSPTGKSQGGAAIGGAFDDWSSSTDVMDFFADIKQQPQRPLPTGSSPLFCANGVGALQMGGVENNGKIKQPIFYKFNDGSCHVIYV